MTSKILRFSCFTGEESPDSPFTADIIAVAVHSLRRSIDELKRKANKDDLRSFSYCEK